MPYPYDRFKPQDMLLRDYLAIDRTALANERTLLAYVQLALTLFIVGMTFLYVPLFTSVWFSVQGWVFVPLAFVAFGMGVVRYRRRVRIIAAIREESPPPEVVAEAQEKKAKEKEEKPQE